MAMEHDALDFLAALTAIRAEMTDRAMNVVADRVLKLQASSRALNGLCTFSWK